MNLEELVQETAAMQSRVQKDYSKSPRRKSRLEVIQNSLSIIDAFLDRLQFERSDISAIAISGLVIRARETLEAMTILCLSGFELPTMSLIRDVLEIEFLLRYFFEHPREISDWVRASRKTRMNRFSPARLRREIAGKDERLLSSMEADYLGHCELGTHPTPVSLKLQRSLPSEMAKELRIWSTVIEVAFHSERIARWVGFLGIIMDPDGKYFKRRLNELKRLSVNLEVDKKAASMLFGARLGRRIDLGSILRLLSEGSSSKRE